MIYHSFSSHPSSYSQKRQSSFLASFTISCLVALLHAQLQLHSVHAFTYSYHTNHISNINNPSRHVNHITHRSLATRKSALIDPALTDTLHSLVHSGPSAATAAADASNAATTGISGVVSTMYSATLPPLDPDTANSISTMKDYFIPTTSNDATIKALEGFVQSKQEFTSSAGAGAGATLPNSSDLIQYDSVMPGAKGISNPSQLYQQQIRQYTYNEKIDKRELEWIAQQFDIYMRKIPFAVTLFALVDFFILSPASTPDVLSDELEDDRMGVVADWFSNALSKLGVLAGIVVAIIFVENLTYHPL